MTAQGNQTPHTGRFPRERSSLDDRQDASRKKVNHNAALTFVRHETLPV